MRIFDEDDFGFRQLGAGAFAIDVAADGGDGRDFGELVEDGDLAHVADVEDVVDAAECWGDFRAEEAVGVGDDAEDHGVRICGAGSVRLRGLKQRSGDPRDSRPGGRRYKSRFGCMRGGQRSSSRYVNSSTPAGCAARRFHLAIIDPVS